LKQNLRRLRNSNNIISLLGFHQDERGIPEGLRRALQAEIADSAPFLPGGFLAAPFPSRYGNAARPTEFAGIS
jgi:hypothetical protein